MDSGLFLRLAGQVVRAGVGQRLKAPDRLIDRRMTRQGAGNKRLELHNPVDDVKLPPTAIGHLQDVRIDLDLMPGIDQYRP
jgi:hypothetical protein